jgi:hypothetical protein
VAGPSAQIKERKKEMKKKMKLVIAISALAAITLIAAGCGSSKSPSTSEHTPAKSAATMPNEDPGTFVKDMTQTIAMISEQTKLNKLEDAKQASTELIALNDKLGIHVMDAKLQEELRQGVLNIQTEVQKPSPSQSNIDQSLQQVKMSLQQVSNGLKSMKH